MHLTVAARLSAHLLTHDFQGKIMVLPGRLESRVNLDFRTRFSGANQTARHPPKGPKVHVRPLSVKHSTVWTAARDALTSVPDHC